MQRLTKNNTIMQDFTKQKTSAEILDVAFSQTVEYLKTFARKTNSGVVELTLQNCGGYAVKIVLERINI